MNEIDIGPIVTTWTFKSVVYLISDKSIFAFLDLLKSDFLIMVMMFGGGILYLLKKWAKWTPWTSDDTLVDKLAERFGLPKKGDDK